MEIWRHRSVQSVGGVRGSPAHVGPCLLTCLLELGAPIPHSPVTLLLRQSCPRQEKCQQPQLPVRYNLELSHSHQSQSQWLSHRCQRAVCHPPPPRVPALCQAWPPPRDPSLPNGASGTLPDSPVLGFCLLALFPLKSQPPSRPGAPSGSSWPCVSCTVPGVPRRISRRQPLPCLTAQIRPFAHQQGLPFCYESLLTHLSWLCPLSLPLVFMTSLMGSPWDHPCRRVSPTPTPPRHAPWEVDLFWVPASSSGDPRIPPTARPGLGVCSFLSHDSFPQTKSRLIISGCAVVVPASFCVQRWISSTLEFNHFYFEQFLVELDSNMLCIE